YISFNINNEWSEPENLGKQINSASREVCPYVTTDGKMFIFSSNRIIDEYKPQALESVDQFKLKSKSFDNGSWNIYYSSTDFINKLKEKHLVKNQTSAKRVDG
ncbi:hypothetical protein E1171_16515, partial [Cytophagales bacterium RKSG123]|nr:hypothetical protein [Xanthovirga aplysinae]